jgi:transcription termination factor Rho
MSVAATTLERSALERKDREELSAIAIALGAKPGSRTKKADMIDMILQATGVHSGPTPEPTPSSGTAEAADAPPKRARTRARSDASPAGAETSTGAAPAAEVSGDQQPPDTSPASSPAAAAAPDEEPPAEWERDAAATADSTGADSADASTPATGSGRGDSDGRQGGQRSQSNGGQQPRDRNQGGQSNQGGRNQGAQNQGGRNQGGQGNQGGDDGEPGNRRRRRRGRDRDRQGNQGPQPDRSDEPFTGEPVEVEGLLDLRDEGYGFLRLKQYRTSKDDVYISVKQTRQFNLRRGDHVKGASRPAQRNEKNPALLRIDLVNGQDPELARNRPRFEDLTPLFPDEKLRLETTDQPLNMTARIIDLVSPIGKGQRGLIVSPPKAGKTTVMKQIAQSIEANNPEVHLMVLLVDERPEEVTDMRRTVRGDVIASTFDRPSDEHTLVAEMAIERAKRMVEDGRDVVIILDGITRLARAYNLAAPSSGRIMSGGIDTGALYPPKKFFGAARNIEEGGSLTILATALVETGSKMDEVIFEEFKGTGNMELRLDRRLAERRIYPAIDVDASSTRHEELLFDRKQLQQVWKLRRVLSGLAAESSGGAGLEMLIDRLATFKDNDDFLAEVAKAPTGG